MDGSLQLTAKDVLLLTDRIKTGNMGQEEMRVVPYRLLAKLGSVYLELVQDTQLVDGEIPVTLTEAEAWLCLDTISSLDRWGEDGLVGVRLKRKLFALLLAINSPALPGLTAEDGIDERRVTERLARWRSVAGLPWLGGP